MLNRPYDMSLFAGEDDDSGIRFQDFQTALQVWSFLQPQQTSVRQCAEAFGVTDDVIRKAAREHYWMFITGPDGDPTKQLVEHDGE